MFPAGDGHTQGVFRRDPSLKEFLTSPRAGRAFMTMVLTFLSKTSPDQCRAILDAYAEGGDDGVTRRVMRRACSLPEEEAVASSHQPVATSAACDANTPVPVVLVPHDEKQEIRSMQLLDYCLANGKDLLSTSLVSRMPSAVWPGTSPKMRAKLFDELVAAGLWRRLPRRGRVPDPTVPVLRAAKGFADLFPMISVPERCSLPEQIAGDTLIAMVSDPVLVSNNAVLSEHCCLRVKQAERKGSGIWSAADKEAYAAAVRARGKLLRAHAEVDALVSEVRNHERGMGDLVASPQGNTITCQREYTYKIESWGRRYVSKGGAQAWSRSLRTRLLPGPLEDLDVQNAMVSLVSQVVAMMGVKVPIAADVLKPWVELAEDPGKYRSMFSRQMPGQGKSILLRVAHGGAAAATGAQELDSWLGRLSTAARFLRWVAVSQMPQVHDWNIARSKDWPENTTFAYWWHTVEDKVLGQLLDVVTEEGRRVPAHVSLHFDGLLVTRADLGNVEEAVAQAEAKVLAELGLVVSLVRKTHCVLLDLLATFGTPVPGAVQVPDFWQAQDRALPFHLAVVSEQWGPLSEECARHVPPAVCPQRWRYWSDILFAKSREPTACSLRSTPGLAFSANGKGFLLHCQTATGSCTSAAVLPTPAKAWQVVVGADAWVLDTAAFERAFDLAVDASTIVSFCLASSHAAPDALLDLQVHV